MILSLAFPAAMASGQFSGNNLIEYQYGKLPLDPGSRFSTIYGRTMAGYNFRGFSAGVTLENFYSPFSGRNYTSLAQYRLHYTTGNLEVKLGNFYETLGRGLLLRSYDIHGAVLEDLSYRSRHYFHRDISGAMARFRGERFSTTVLYGKPLNNAFPPGMKLPSRRADNIAAVHSDYSFKKQVAGASVLLLDNDIERALYGMTSLTGSLWPFLSYYTGFARQIDRYGPGGFSGDVPWALYASLNISAGSMGMSLEYKKYNEFELGAGFNEPPALVKEHSYRVLNRSTHVSQSLNETGYQAELFYLLPDASMLTFNHTLAVNEFIRRFVFREYFIEYSGSPAMKHDIRMFADLAQDQLKQEETRVSAGIYAGWNTGGSLVISTDLEYQNFDRNGSTVTNMFFSLGSVIRSRFSGSLVMEISNDPFLTGESWRTWTGVNCSYRINSRNNIIFFAGRRRGGPACQAGICYEILDFDGAELRLTSRF